MQVKSELILFTFCFTAERIERDTNGKLFVTVIKCPAASIFAGFQTGIAFPIFPTFPYFFDLLLLFHENALLSLLFHSKNVIHT